MKLEKLNEIANQAISYSWLGFIALAAYVGKKMIDFIFKSVIESVIKNFLLTVNKEIEEKLNPLRDTNSEIKKANEEILGICKTIVHMLRNKDHGEAGALDLILVRIEEARNEKK